MQIESRSSGPALLKRDEVVERVKRIVAEFTDLEPERMRPDHQLVADLGCDSLDVVEIAMEIEEQFDIAIPDAVEQARTIEEIVDGVVRLLADCEDV